MVSDTLWVLTPPKPFFLGLSMPALRSPTTDPCDSPSVLRIAKACAVGGVGGERIGRDQFLKYSRRSRHDEASEEVRWVGNEVAVDLKSADDGVYWLARFLSLRMSLLRSAPSVQFPIITHNPPSLRLWEKSTRSARRSCRPRTTQKSRSLLRLEVTYSRVHRSNNLALDEEPIAAPSSCNTPWLQQTCGRAQTAL